MRNAKFVDWEGCRQIAKGYGYRVGPVAAELGISERSFTRHCCKHFGKSPHLVFAEWRSDDIKEAAKHGKRAKEMLAGIGISHASSLSGALKRDAGVGLHALRQHAV